MDLGTPQIRSINNGRLKREEEEELYKLNGLTLRVKEDNSVTINNKNGVEELNSNPIYRRRLEKLLTKMATAQNVDKAIEFSMPLSQMPSQYLLIVLGKLIRRNSLSVADWENVKRIDEELTGSGRNYSLLDKRFSSIPSVNDRESLGENGFSYTNRSQMKERIDNHAKTPMSRDIGNDRLRENETKLNRIKEAERRETERREAERREAERYQREILKRNQEIDNEYGKSSEMGDYLKAIYKIYKIYEFTQMVGMSRKAAEFLLSSSQNKTELLKGTVDSTLGKIKHISPY